MAWSSMLDAWLIVTPLSLRSSSVKSKAIGFCFYLAWWVRGVALETSVRQLKKSYALRIAEDSPVITCPAISSIRRKRGSQEEYFPPGNAPGRTPGW
jgi:hypothetical protein